MGSRIFKRPAVFVVPVLLAAVSIFLAVGFYSLFTKPAVLADASDAQVELFLDDNEVILSDGEMTICSFTPNEDGLYQFSSITDSVNPYAYLYDEDGLQLGYNDNCSWNNTNFQIICRLEAGKTYILRCATYYSLYEDTKINVNISIAPEYELELGVDNEVDLRTERQYEECYFTPAETAFYVFSISAGNAEPDWYFYDANAERVSLPRQNRSSFTCKLNAGERYNLKIGSGYIDSGIIATVTITKYTPDTSGMCGDSVAWSYDITTGALTISGTGKMYDFSDYEGGESPVAPWFLFKYDMKSVVIGNGITNVGDNAFYSCKTLETATIGKDVEKLGYFSFQHCTKLKSVIFSPDSVLADIGTSAFACCDSLESISIPATVTKMNNTVFSACKNLTDVVLPERLESMGTGLFEGCESLPSIVIPEGITSIGASMFYDCYLLTDVTIPDSVESIDGTAFYYCSALENISIPSGVTSIADEAFMYCRNLKSIEIPDSVRYIGSSAFYSCYSLTSVKIPEGVEVIRDDTFYYCSNLTEVSIPNTVKSIGESAFAQCVNLPKIVLPDSLEVIGENAFFDCDSLASVTFGKHLTTIGKGAFSYCDILKEITIPESVENIYGSAFRMCNNLEKVTIQSGAIWEYAFYNCSKLETVILGSKVSRVGDYSFYECGSLQSISIPGSVGIIGEGAFSWCYELKDVTIEEGVQTIGSQAFLNCRKITEITIPASVTEIRDSAFNDCSGITDVYCYANPEKLSWTKANNDFMPWSGGAPFGRTNCHVFSSDLDAYEAKFGSGQSNFNYRVNVTFVGDLPETIDLGLGEHLYGCTLSLSGDIGVNFYMDLSSAELSEDAYVEFAIPNGGATVTKKVYVQAKDGENRTVAETVPNGENTYYVFKCQVSAKEVSSPIQAQMIDGERSGKKYTYSVKAYADYLLAHTNDNAEYANAAPLVKALVSYCSWSQFYFSGSYAYHIDYSYLNDNEIAAVSGSELLAAAPQAVTRLDGLSGVTFEGATLSLKSETTLSLYFSSSETLTFSCNYDNAIETTRVGDYQVVRIRGIAAADLDEVFEIKVICGDNSGMVHYSVLNYISNVVNGDYDNELNCVVKALYLYYKAAEAFA